MWCWAWPRHGVHSNGFSLVRKCIERAEAAGTVPATLDGKPFKPPSWSPPACT
jgi:phosphoribosylformylglycinamidine cyclo-ligase